MERSQGVVSRETLKRVISDISEIMKHPLHDHGIYYEHDEKNMLMGYVLIIPQNEGTPYQFGNYLFTIEYPTNYPYSPPKMTYLTNNGNTRFHPNLYRNGKVCLSLLNTWKGEQWTSCNTLSSILLNVTTLFTKDPLLHEPGINEDHESLDTYSKIIEYQNYNTAIYNVMNSNKILNCVNGANEIFKDVIHHNYKKNMATILSNIEKRVNETPYYETPVDVPFYKMYDQWLDYKELFVKLKEYNSKLV